MERQTDMEFTHGSMETDMKANLSNVLNMAKGYKNLLMEIPTEEPTRMANPMVMASIFGVMEALTRVTLSRDSEMERVFGENQTNPTLILMKENSLTKKNKGMVTLLGPMAANTLELSLTMSGKVTEKCIGVMETCTKGNGTMEPKLKKFQNL
jgi:hypothetical protein